MKILTPQANFIASKLKSRQYEPGENECENAYKDQRKTSNANNSGWNNSLPDGDDRDEPSVEQASTTSGGGTNATMTDYSTQVLNATTLCLYLKQFALSTRTKVSVCSYQGAVRIDIRHFIGERSTIRGIWLNTGEWRALLHLWGAIQAAVADAQPHVPS